MLVREILRKYPYGKSKNILDYYTTIYLSKFDYNVGDVKIWLVESFPEASFDISNVEPWCFATKLLVILLSLTEC